MTLAELEPSSDECPDSAKRRRLGLDGGPGGLTKGFQVLFQDTQIDLALGFEIEIERTLGDGTGFGDVVHGCAVVAMAGEDLARSFQNARAAKLRDNLFFGGMGRGHFTDYIVILPY